MMALSKAGFWGVFQGAITLGNRDVLLLTGMAARFVAQLCRYSAVLGLLWLPYAGEAMPLFGVGWQLVCAMAGECFSMSDRLGRPARRHKAVRSRKRDGRFQSLIRPAPLSVEEFPFRWIWNSPKQRAKFARRQLLRMHHQPFKP